MVRVFLLSSRGIFGQGLECLLRRQAEFEVVGHVADVDAAVEQICELKPAAVVVVDGDAEHDPAIIMARIAFSGFKVKVIGLDLNTNTLTLYRPEHHHVRRVEDLVTVITADPTDQL